MQVYVYYVTIQNQIQAQRSVHTAELSSDIYAIYYLIYRQVYLKYDCFHFHGFSTLLLDAWPLILPGSV